jgi:hypothetical protein
MEISDHPVLLGDMTVFREPHSGREQQEFDVDD